MERWQNDWAPGEPAWRAKVRWMQAHSLFGACQGQQLDIEVGHGDWCASTLGRACNCDPDIRVRPQGARRARRLDNGDGARILGAPKEAS
jgi:hypothetical protein